MKRKVFVDCIKKNKLSIVIFFLLYDVMKEPFIYAEVLLLTVLILLLGIDYTGELRSACLREDQKNSILLSNSACGDTLRDTDYFEMLSSQRCQLRAIGCKPIFLLRSKRITIITPHGYIRSKSRSLR